VRSSSADAAFARVAPISSRAAARSADKAATFAAPRTCKPRSSQEVVNREAISFNPYLLTVYSTKPHDNTITSRVSKLIEKFGEPDPDIQLMPGMPAKILIVTGQQTLVQYALKPFTDVLRVFI
jgi:hypothetical protein